MSGGKPVKKWIITILLIIAIFIIVRTVQYQRLSEMGDNTVEEKPIIITVLAGQSTSDAGIEDMIDEYLAVKYPNVLLEWECVDWGENFDSQLQARIAAGDVPSIMVGKAQDVYTYAKGGNLAAIPTTCTDKIEEQALQAVTLNGIVYGLPYNVMYQGIIYNKDIFEKLDLAPPTNLIELDETVSILNDNKVTPFAAHFQESWKVGNMTMQFFMNEMFRDQPNWGEQFREGSVSFSNNDIIKACLEQNQYILVNSWEDAMMIDQYECDRRFYEGEAAMYLTGSWSLQSINLYNENKEYGIFPFPNQSGDAKLIRETNMTFMKSNFTKHSDLVDQILEELVINEELIQDIIDFTQTYSVIKGVEPKYQSIIENDVNRYEENGQVIEVTSGNNQLIWTFQNDLAMKQQEWLQKKIFLDDVLHYADQNRLGSSN